MPFIDLQRPIDLAACFAEASALLPRFVQYQSDPRYNITHWRGLGLRALGGDPARVAVAHVGPNDRYETTPIAQECPATMAFLRELLDWERAHSVAFLALRPGSRIAPHIDDPQHEVMRSVNVALNMPAGCRFMIDTQPDGSAGPFTREVPFVPGSVMMVNVARYHYVDNRSAETRIHLVARGPLRGSAASLRDRARAQNQLFDEESLRAALDLRYARLGRPSDHDPEPTRYQPKRRVEPRAP